MDDSEPDSVDDRQHAHTDEEDQFQEHQDGSIGLKNKCAIGHRVKASRSVLALILDEDFVFAGLQGGDIVAWSLETYELVLSVPAHKESVLGLYLSEDRNLLFSSGGDSVVNVWSTRTFERLYSIYSHHDVGDIFATVYSTALKTVYCGGQNTSLQWCNLKKSLDNPLPDLSVHPSNRTHRFFDSKGPGGVPSPRPESNGTNGSFGQGGQALTFRRDQHRLFSHNGYVYSMLLVRGLMECSPGEELLLTGSGDGSVKMWRLGNDPDSTPVQFAELQNGTDSVLSMAVEGSFLYCGLEGGSMNIWNLDSHQIVKKIRKHTGDLWAIDIIKGIAIGGDSHGIVKKFNSRFEEIGSWTAHQGTMLASAAGIFRNRCIYATGGNDNSVAIWDLTEHAFESSEIVPISNDEMVNSLAKFVAFKTISSKPKFHGECNKGALFLKRHCNYLGAKTSLLTTGQDTNPIVYARFNATSNIPDKKTILFYGHYDVVGADANQHKWKTDPYQLKSINGYLYGRGVSDNKGPILAALYAAAGLARKRSLHCDVVFLIEGEEESGSQGFETTVREHKEFIGDVDWILLANSYWLDDYIPCLTYGLRGVVHANLVITSHHPDLHSGIDGSALLDEPLKDLTMLLGTLVGRKGEIKFPGFDKNILQLTKAEKKRYDGIAEALLPHHPEITDYESFTKSLMHRWREPSLTIHRIEVPGSLESSTTISRKAKAAVSIRLVPNQDADSIAAKLIEYVEDQFAELGSQNKLTVEITGKSDPWLGDPDNEIFGTLSEAITAAWSPLKDSRKYNYPTPERPRAFSRPVLLRNDDSSDNLASLNQQPTHEPRLRPVHHGPPIPTSSTLTKGTNSIYNNVNANNKPESGATSPSRSYPPSPMPPAQSNTPPCQHQLRPQTQHPCLLPPLPSTSNPQQSPDPNAQHPITPIYIREGGSIPTIRCLEKVFDAPAAHLPCGQASDHAHLDNERLRVENLYKSREIFRYVFEELPRKEG